MMCLFAMASRSLSGIACVDAIEAQRVRIRLPSPGLRYEPMPVMDAPLRITGCCADALRD